MMKKYKSLVFREWKILQDRMKYAFLLLFSFVALSFLTFYLNPEEDFSSFPAFISLFLFVVTAFMCLGENDVYKSDKESGWLTYAECLPITPDDRAKSATLLLVLEIVVMFAVDIIGYGINGFAAGVKMNPGLLVLSIILFDIYIGIYVLKTAVMTFCPKGQEKKGQIVLCIIACLVISYIIIKVFPIMNRINDMSETEMKNLDLPKVVVEEILKLINKVGVVAMPLLIVIVVAYFFVSGKKYEKEKRYE